MTFRLFFVNDLNEVDDQQVLQEIKENTNFSFSFIALLISSSIVCTLGLLLDSAPIVIGGMLIAPVVWPLLKIAFGISYARPSYIRQSISLLLVCIVVGLASACVITFLSPVKVVTDEILARTNPTLLDVGVAIVAGSIAAFALVQPRISESFAGVAIATSLMPPLCVAGIGIAMLDWTIFSGGFLLFIINIVSIMFVTILIFFFSGVKRKEGSSLRRRGFFLIAAILLILLIPLYSLLKAYSFELGAHGRVQLVLEEALKTISQSASIETLKTTMISRDGKDVVFIAADLLLPESTLFDYQNQNEIVSALEQALERNVDVQFTIQRTVSVRSEEDVLQQELKRTIQETLHSEIDDIDSSLTIDLLEINQTEQGQDDANAQVDDETTKTKTWIVEMVLRGDPTVSVLQAEREALQQSLVQAVQAPVLLNIEIVPRVQLLAAEDVENETLKQLTQEAITALNPAIAITSMTVKNIKIEVEIPKIPPRDQATLDIDMTVPKGFVLDPEQLIPIKQQLEERFAKDITLTVNLIERATYAV